MTTHVRSAERRKTIRQPRCLRLSWRALGNRDFSYGAAALQDISTDGVAMQVEQFCKKGTVVIVQFEAAGRWADPMLLRAEWCRGPEHAKDGATTYLVGCSFTSPLTAGELNALLASAKHALTKPASVKPALAECPAQADPFLVGSANEKRVTVRRVGLSVPVLVARSGAAAVDAVVIDRSLKGLGILISAPVTRGTALTVRPRDTHDQAMSVQVQVSNCRQKGKQWHLGCQFPHTPAANVLMCFG